MTSARAFQFSSEQPGSSLASRPASSMRPGHAVLVGQQGLGIGLDERPGIGKALLVLGAQAVKPLGIGIFDVADRLDAHVAAIGPFQQGSRRDDGFQRAADSARAQPKAGAKASSGSERENREFSPASSGPTLPVSAVTVEEGMLSLAEAEELEAASAAGRGAAACQHAAQQGGADQQGKNTLANHRKASFYRVPAHLPEKLLWYISSILFCRAVVNRRAQDDFSPRLCKLYKLLFVFFSVGRD